MSLSFYDVIQALNEDLEDNETDVNMNVIRIGLNQSPDFWDKFISLCNNAGDLAVLLEVPKHRIMQWGPKIKKLVEQAKHQQGIAKKNRMIPTGISEQE